MRYMVLMTKDVEKLNELITDCLVRRLTSEEALDYIKKNGIKLSESTYRRYKKELEDKTQERILEEDKARGSEFLRRLDAIKKIEKEYWSLFSNTKNESLKGKLLRLIQDLQDTSENCFVEASRRARHIREQIEEEKDAEVEYKKRRKEKEYLESQEGWKQRIKEEFENEEVVSQKSNQKIHSIAE